MISFFSGAILLAGVSGAFWRLLPQDGVPHRLAVAPFFQTWIPIGLTSGFVMGAGLMVSGLVSLISF